MTEKKERHFTIINYRNEEEKNKTLQKILSDKEIGLNSITAVFRLVVEASHLFKTKEAREAITAINERTQKSPLKRLYNR